MVYDTAERLAREMKESDEYIAYEKARELIAENETTRTLIDEYHRMQIQAQAASVSGQNNQELLQKLQKVGELLQFDPAAASYLIAEFRLNRMLADVYKTLASAVGIDLAPLEN